jgi:hypothetical protein
MFSYKITNLLYSASFLETTIRAFAACNFAFASNELDVDIELLFPA